MSFGKRGLAANTQAMGQAGFGQAAQSSYSAGIGEEPYVLRYTKMEALFGALGMAVCWYFLEPALSGGAMTGKAIFMSVVLALGFLGCAFLCVAGLQGKMKLTVDSNGLAQGTLMGESRLDWPDVEGFEILTVNYNKSVFAKAKKASMMSMAKKVRIPVGAFKSRNYELLTWMRAHRPDLVPQMLAVMSKVGAKRLVKDLTSDA